MLHESLSLITTVVDSYSLHDCMPSCSCHPPPCTLAAVILSPAPWQLSSSTLHPGSCHPLPCTLAAVILSPAPWQLSSTPLAPWQLSSYWPHRGDNHREENPPPHRFRLLARQWQLSSSPRQLWTRRSHCSTGVTIWPAMCDFSDDRAGGTLVVRTIITVQSHLPGNSPPAKLGK
jgi:hypothetical protein